MQLTFALVWFGLSTVLGDVAPYPPSGWKPQRALLILPPQNRLQNDAPPQPVQDKTENLDELNENVMERLRKESGSDSGVYYVYLPDGRLQRVQYTTAPVSQQDPQQSQQYSEVTSPQQTGQYKQNQVGTSNNSPGNQQSNYQLVFGTNKHSNQGNQQQYNKYQDQQQIEESKLQGNTQYQPVQQDFDNKTSESGNPSQILAQYNLEQNSPAANYLASVQFTDVPPISGPIFAYSPSPLVRIVRYANNYY